MPLGGTKRRQAALARIGRPKRRLGIQQVSNGVIGVNHHRTDPTSDLSADLLVVKKLLEQFRRTVVIPDSKLAHLPGDTPTKLLNVSPVRMTLVSLARHHGLTEARIQSLRQNGSIFLWPLPSTDTAMTVPAEINTFVSAK